MTFVVHVKMYFYTTSHFKTMTDVIISLYSDLLAKVFTVPVLFECSKTKIKNKKKILELIVSIPA